jgi:hypothetical protein
MMPTQSLAFRRVRSLFPRVRAGAMHVAASVSRRLHSVRPKHVLWVIMTVALVLYVLVLLLHPTAVGRGGR